MVINLRPPTFVVLPEHMLRNARTFSQLFQAARP